MIRSVTDWGGGFLLIAVVVGLGIALFLLIGRDDGQSADPPGAAPPSPPTAAPAPPTTTTTANECFTRAAWLAEDRGRYLDAEAEMWYSADQMSESASNSEMSNRWYGEYARDYGRGLDLWLRYEEDAEALLRDCWDVFDASTIAWHRDYLADHNEMWYGLRSLCRSARAFTASNDYAWDPWTILGVSC